MTNHKPQADSSDYAIWQRLLLVPFRLSFVDNPSEVFERPRDPGLLEKSKQEASGILAWHVRGFQAYQERGLDAPASVLSATDDYRDEVDDVARFLSECCVTGEDSHKLLTPLYKAYEEWCGSEGFRSRGRNKFAAKLEELGFTGGRTGAGKRHTGLTLDGVVLFSSRHK